MSKQRNDKEWHAAHYQANKERLNASNIAYKKANPEKNKLYNRRAHFKRKYGITIDEYEQMVIQQNNLCKICNKPETFIDYKTQKIRDLAVDHCHTTGKVRGLLCDACNKGLGFFKDKPDLMLKGAQYVQENS